MNKLFIWKVLLFSVFMNGLLFYIHLPRQICCQLFKKGRKEGVSVSDVAFYKADRDNPKQSPSGTGLSKKGHLDFWDVAAGDVWNCWGLTSCPRCLIWCSRCLRSVRDEGVVSGGWKTIQNCSHLQVQSRLELFVSQFISSEVNWSTDMKRTHLRLKSILIFILRRGKNTTSKMFDFDLY